MRTIRVGKKSISEKEIWRRIPKTLINGKKKIYKVSNHGRIKSVPKKKNSKYKTQMRKPVIRKDGYLHLRLPDFKGRGKNFLLHRVVAITFIPNPKNRKEVNHKDNNPENNCTENLEWMTTKQNIRHAHRNGFVKTAKGDKHPMAILTMKIVIKLRKWSKGRIGKRGLIPKLVKRLRKKYGIRKITREAVGDAIRGKTWN